LNETSSKFGLLQLCRQMAPDQEVRDLFKPILTKEIVDRASSEVYCSVDPVAVSRLSEYILSEKHLCDHSHIGDLGLHDGSVMKARIQDTQAILDFILSWGGW